MEGLVGGNPPYHAPTFVLTHYEREPIVMEGEATFFFVTGGIEEALELAKKAGLQSRSGAACQPCGSILKAGLIDSLHLAMAPVLLGQGEAVFQGLDLHALGFSVTDRKSSEYATYRTLDKV